MIQHIETTYLRNYEETVPETVNGHPTFPSLLDLWKYQSARGIPFEQRERIPVGQGVWAISAEGTPQ